MTKKSDNSIISLKKLGDIFTKFLIFVAILLFIIEVLFHRHGEYSLEESFMFPAFFGFVAFIFIVQIGKFLRLLIMRKEDYYDD